MECKGLEYPHVWKIVYIRRLPLMEIWKQVRTELRRPASATAGTRAGIHSTPKSFVLLAPFRRHSCLPKPTNPTIIID